MALIQKNNNDEQIKQIWAQTLQTVTDPGLTVHELPPVSDQELQKLAQTIQQATPSIQRPTLSHRETRTHDPNGPPMAATIQNTVTSAGSPQTHPVSTSASTSNEVRQGVQGQDFFIFEKQIGKGGMGEVFCARQGSLQRNVAIKTLRHEDKLNTQQKAAFLREALTTGALTHPNIVPVHLFGRDEEGRLFIAMKRVEGRPWSDVLAAQSKTNAEAPEGAAESELAKNLEIFQKVCDAMAFAHGKGIIHRDLKPENVMIGAFGEVLVMDWGLALDVSEEERVGMGIARDHASIVAGTPAFMAPEMALGKMDEIGMASDIYLLGAILHEILTGRPPHTGASLMATLTHAAEGKLDPIRPRPGLPKGVRELERIIRKAMAVDPKDRYENVSALQDEVRSYVVGQSNRTESDALAQAAREALTTLAKETDGLRVTSPYYPRCAAILAKSQQSLARWGFNPRAVRVRQETLALYADLALRGQDWGLAESLLIDLKLSGSGGSALSQPIHQRLVTDREKWRHKQELLKKTARVAAFFMLGMTGLAIYFWAQWHDATRDHGVAIKDLGNSGDSSIQSRRVYRSAHRGPLLNAKKKKNPAQASAPQQPSPKAEASRRKSFATRRGPSWQPPLPRSENADPDFKPTSPLRGMRLNAQGKFLLWDQKGTIWIGRPGLLAEETELLYSSRTPITCALSIDNQKIFLAKSSGEVLVGDSAKHPWNTVMRLREPAEMLAGSVNGTKVRIAATRGGNIWIATIGSEKTKHIPLASPVLALDFQANGNLCVVTRTSVEIHPTKGPKTLLTLNEEMDKAVLLDSAGKAMLVPAARLGSVASLVIRERKVNTIFTFSEGEVRSIAATWNSRFWSASSDTGAFVLLDVQERKILGQGQVPEKTDVLALSETADTLHTLSEGSLQAWQINRHTPVQP